MNFLKFASNNVLRNIKVYFAYFLSSAFSAVIFFFFTMVILHPNLKRNQFKSDIRISIMAAQIIIYVFLIMFVFYSVSVFLKSRYKEFGTLFILGMSKKQISRMIFIENLIISSMSTLTGIVFGLVFSKFFLLFASKLLNIEDIKFYFPYTAIFITIVCFLILFITISFLTSFLIRENEVLKLLKGSKKNKVEPRIYITIIITAVVFLCIAYFKAATATEVNLEKTIFPVILIVILSTYFLFSQCTVFIIKFFKKNRRIYMKKTNILWISDMFYRIRDNSRMFFIVTITSAVAITSMAAVYTYYLNIKADTLNNFPQAIFYLNKEDDSTIEKLIDKSLKQERFTYSKIVGITKRYNLNEKLRLNLIKESDYNKMALNLGLKPLQLKEGETFKVPGVYQKAPYKIDNKNLNIDGKNLAVIGVAEKNIFPSSLIINIYVLRDEFWNKLHSEYEYYYLYTIKDWEKTLNMGKQVQGYFKNNGNIQKGLLVFSAVIYEINKESAGILIFLALFIGLVFFFTSGSFIYNKFYMDSGEDKQKYKNISKMGITYREIKRIINIEMGIVFFLPYFVAVIHSIFALTALKSAYGMKISKPLFIVIGSFFIFQVVYFIVYKNRYLKEIRREI